jgi:type 1 glutamine amidotransferase
LVCVALTLAAARAWAAEPAAEKPILVLSVTGLDSRYHDWRARSEAIYAALSADRRFEVHRAEDPELLAAPALGKYPVVFLHYRNLQPLAQADAVRRSLAAYVRGGGGLVAIHGALGAFPNWPEYVRIVGRVWGPKTGHDRRGPFPVTICDTQHPLTRGLTQFTADDELFSGLTGDTPVQVLATAASKRAGAEVPTAWALKYGQGRVFGSTLGHDAQAIRTPGTAELLRRACLWAARHDPGQDTATRP